MDFAELLTKIWNRHILFSVMLELTYRCDLNCFYCYNEKSATGKRLELADYRRLLTDLRQMGALNLTLSGGEPLLSPLFFDLGRAARAAGFAIRVKTNGHTLDREQARRLKEDVAPFIVEVSLHGATVDTHDRQTRHPGSFSRLMDNLETMRSMGLRLQLNATLTVWNEEEIEKMYALADRLHLPLLMDSRISPRDSGGREPIQIAASPEGVERLLSIRHRRRQELHESGDGACDGQGHAASKGRTAVRYHCGAGVASVTVDPFGNVYPCVQWRRPLGNLHERSIGDIWKDTAVLEEVRRIIARVKEKVAEEGEEGVAAAFCPGLAEQLVGSPECFDAGMKYRLQILKKLAGKAATACKTR